MTFQRLEEIAFGCLRIKPKSLYKLTAREFIRMLNGYIEMRDADTRQSLETARFHAWLILRSFASSHIEKTDVYRFDWDVIKPIKVMSAERFAVYQKIIEKSKKDGRPNSIQTKS